MQRRPLQRTALVAHEPRCSRDLLVQARAGFLVTGKVGTGLVVAKRKRAQLRPQRNWSQPLAIGCTGVSFGMQAHTHTAHTHAASPPSKPSLSLARTHPRPAISGFVEGGRATRQNTAKHANRTRPEPALGTACSLAQCIVS